MLRLRRTRTRGDRVSAALLDACTALWICRAMVRMRRGRSPLIRRRARRRGRVRRLLA